MRCGDERSSNLQTHALTIPSAGFKISEKPGMVSPYENCAFRGGMMHFLTAAFTTASVMCAASAAFAGNDADKFLVRANASPLNEIDCTNAGGVDLVQPMFDKVFRSAVKAKVNRSIFSYEGKTYVVFMVPNPYMGRAVQSMHLCEFP
jgi:hypothetical protein